MQLFLYFLLKTLSILTVCKGEWFTVMSTTQNWSSAKRLPLLYVGSVWWHMTLPGGKGWTMSLQHHRGIPSTAPTKNPAMPSSCMALLTGTPLMGESVVQKWLLSNEEISTKAMSWICLSHLILDHTCGLEGWRNLGALVSYAHSFSDVPAGGQFCI